MPKKRNHNLSPARSFLKVKFKKLLTGAVGIVAFAACGASSSDAPDLPDFKPAEQGIEFADPFILLDGDTYYAYGTGDTSIDVYTSDDLKHWTRAGRALNHTDSYGDHWFWAPEIYRVGDRYLMYYTSEEHTCVAEATSPLGPFVQKEKKPLFDGLRTIDNTLFIDTDGTPYMFYDIFDDRGGHVHVVELTDDLLAVRNADHKPCIAQSQAWETEAVNEGTFVVKHGDTYYMTYSGNGYTNPAYGLGVATASSPLGPWTKYENNPIFQFPVTKEYGRLEGVGHSAMFIDKEGKMRIVFHAHNKPGTVHPREMYISTVEFTDEAVPRMIISEDNVIKAVLKK